jgi:polyisoprenyl-teichoic acid--peptidoglycan teichoic acid transferase
MYRARPATGPHRTSAPDVMTERARARYKTESSRRRIRTIVVGLVALLLIAGGVGAAYVNNAFVKPLETITDVFLTPEANRPPSTPGGTPIPITYPDWSKKQPVNILLIGLDYRPGEEDSRADTQIIVHIDPQAKTAAMVAIPRDLWVPVPGFEEGRINTAYQKGESNKDTVPGGGPGLAKATIEDNFGIPIHYYAQVNFTGFETIIDTIGGLTIDVPRPLVDNEYPLGNYGVTRIYIPAGLQHMDGHTALAYARSRHSDSDLGRNARQQQVLLAIRQQGLNLNLITKLNELSGQLSDAVKTDLSLVQVGSLAQLAKDIKGDAIQTVTIDADMVRQTILPNGADVLLPNWDLIKPKIAQAFSDPRLSKEAARLSVQNGTTVGGIGKKVRDQLVSKGFFVPDLRSTDDQGTHPVTTITDYSGGTKPHTIEALVKELDLKATDVIQGDPAEAPTAQTDGAPVDIMVIAGDDQLR